MANTKSAEKQNRQMQKHRIRNAHVLSTLRTQVRKVRESLEGTDQAKSETELKAAIRLISKAATKGVIHKSQASRRIARLSKSVSTKKAAAK